MGSGESDARIVTIKQQSDTVTGGNFNYFDSSWYTYPNTSTISWSYTNTIYKYQVKCPVRSCKKMNWLELDKITPCVKCTTKLKAVAEQPDFEIPVEK